MGGGGGGAGTTVQCLVGPLLWATLSEMPMKAERIRPKDLSLRVDTSSDVMPSVSIFGRIFNRMVPGWGGGVGGGERKERSSESVRHLVSRPSVCRLFVCPDAAENFRTPPRETRWCPLSCG